MKNIAIITGASSGIGREFALTVESHAKYDELWAIARNVDRLEDLKKDIKIHVRPISLDLSAPDAHEQVGKLLQDENVRVGLLMNCSGFGKFEATEKISLEDNLGMIDLNCRALTAMTLTVLPYMDKGSELVNIASVAAFQPIPYINVYGASKAYVLSFTRALGRELKSRGIRVLAVCPFWTKTRFFDRAVRTDKEAIVKKYVAMYTPDFIVKTAWHALEKTKKDYIVPGFKAKAQVLLVKLLPHSLVMSTWMNQQKLK